MKSSFFRNVSLVAVGILIGSVFMMRMDWIPTGIAAPGDDRKNIILGNKNFDFNEI